MGKINGDCKMNFKNILKSLLTEEQADKYYKLTVEGEDYFDPEEELQPIRRGKINNEEYKRIISDNVDNISIEEFERMYQQIYGGFDLYNMPEELSDYPFVKNDDIRTLTWLGYDDIRKPKYNDYKIEKVFAMKHYDLSSGETFTRRADEWAKRVKRDKESAKAAAEKQKHSDYVSKKDIIYKDLGNTVLAALNHPTLKQWTGRGNTKEEALNDLMRQLKRFRPEVYRNNALR